MRKIGLLLNNIGTPMSFRPRDVARYLREFLMDPDVISLPRPFRDLLVKGIIVPLRARRSAEKYRKIWLSEGSPLLVHSQKFAEGLQTILGESYLVRLGMSYGAPSISQTLEEFALYGVDQILFVPLFPQWSQATVESARRQMQRLNHGRFQVVYFPPFYREDFFIRSQAEIISEFLARHPVDRLLFSYHSLPESQIREQGGCLLTADCCERPRAEQKPCYRAQCFATSTALALQLNLPGRMWSTSFQSRLGPAKWIGPATSEEIIRLAERGVQRLAVTCPSFVTDCLETLEEIGMEMRDLFLSRGGKEFHLIPCLNSDERWITRFAQEVRVTQPQGIRLGI